ncbi:hypothetical protein ACRQ5D_10195 [Mucilaginibacter sp. P25]|uniref:Uncharacterized protein n=1 Tax=Mucilaginibacter gossypii TaxID=551996 RepID=A0A1G8NTW7_9SPHI|nr:hypothetical protein [Mucilaginibacter gossypii]SDI83721.1 hypothetical protein SAMN05192573_13617 [Mucilaginibacter gossypii]
MSFFKPKSQKESSGYFIPSINGFSELTNPPLNASFNDISNSLGYHIDQIQMYLGDYDPNNEIQAVGLEILSDNIVFICTKKSVVKLSEDKVRNFLKKFNIKDEFDDVSVSAILNEGIKNESLTVEFLSKVLNLKDTQPNGIFTAISLGLYLYFNNGILTHFQSADGLNECAKHFKQLNPVLIGNYETVAKKYWGQDISKITEEVNIQASALADVPDAINNTFTKLHEGELGTINFRMLMVCHYDSEISLDEFLQINHGRYKHLPSQVDIGTEKYILGKFLYEFSKVGNLINKYQVS